MWRVYLELNVFPCLPFFGLEKRNFLVFSRTPLSLGLKQAALSEVLKELRRFTNFSHNSLTFLDFLGVQVHFDIDSLDNAVSFLQPELAVSRSLQN